MRLSHQKHSNKEIHLIGSDQIRNEKPHQKRPSSHFRRCSAAAQSHTDLRWRTQTLAIRKGYFKSKAEGEKNCLDWPSLRQPWQFCSSLPSAQSGRLSHLSDVNTWTQSLTSMLLFKTIMWSVCRPPPFLDAGSISAVVLEVGALQNVGEWFEYVWHDILKCRKSTGGNSIIYQIIIYIKRPIWHDMIWY